MLRRTTILGSKCFSQHIPFLAVHRGLVPFEVRACGLHTSNEIDERRSPTNDVLPRNDKLTPKRKNGTDNIAMVQNPDETWTAVLDKSSGGVYWWNRQTGHTTAVGAPKPGSVGTVYPSAMSQRVPAGRALLSMAAVGAGMGLMFGIIGKIF